MNSRAEKRFLLVDGLRGIAALSVVVYHFEGAISRNIQHWMPAIVSPIVQRGYLGVDIFFVISGFVIAYSVRNGNHSPNYLFRFWLRRFIRLDPPYWVTIGAEIGLIFLGLLFFPSLKTTMPSLSGVVAHLFYAQNFLGYPNVLPIFWTLCYEVQFYLFVVTLLMIWQLVQFRVGDQARRIAPPLVLGSLFILSLAVRFTGLAATIPGLALDRWFQFFLGVLAWWIVSGKASLNTVLLAWVAILIFVVRGRQGDPEQLVAVCASALIVIAGKRDQLQSWLNFRSIQYLGRISYSLYLLHLPIGWRFLSLAQQRLRSDTALMAWILFLTGIGVSIVAATISYQLLEAPSMRLSKKVRLPTRAASTPIAAPGGRSDVPVMPSALAGSD